MAIRALDLEDADGEFTQRTRREDAGVYPAGADVRVETQAGARARLNKAAALVAQMQHGDLGLVSVVVELGCQLHGVANGRRVEGRAAGRDGHCRARLAPHATDLALHFEEGRGRCGIRAARGDVPAQAQLGLEEIGLALLRIVAEIARIEIHGVQKAVRVPGIRRRRVREPRADARRLAQRELLLLLDCLGRGDDDDHCTESGLAQVGPEGCENLAQWPYTVKESLAVKKKRPADFRRLARAGVRWHLGTRHLWTDQIERSMRRVVILAVLVACAVQVTLFARAERFGADGSVYVRLAQNLAAGLPYEFNHRPHTLYPPGFPVALALAAAPKPDADYAYFVRLMPIAMAVGLLAWYLALRRLVSPGVAAAATLLTAATPAVFALVTRSVVSDGVFFAISGLAVASLSALDRTTRRGARLALCFAVLLLVPISVGVRSAALALVAALVAWPVFDALRTHSLRLDARRVVALAAGGLGLLTFFAWSGWSHRHDDRDYPGQHTASYFSQVAKKDPHRPEMGSATATDILRRIPRNSIIHAAHLGSLLLGGTWIAPLWFSPVVIGILALLVTGVVRAIRSWRDGWLGWYLLSYLGLYALWPFDEGPRFMIPAAPLAFAAMAEGATVAWRWYQRQPERALGVVSGTAAGILALAAASAEREGIQASASVAVWGLGAASGAGALFVRRAAARRRQSPTGTSGTRRVASRWWILLLAPSLALSLSRTLTLARENVAPRPTTYRHAPAVDAAEWLRSAGPGSVMAAQVAIIHRLSDRRVIAFPATTDAALIADVLRGHEVQYLVVADPVPFEYFEPNEQTRLTHLQEAFPDLLVESHRGPGYRVFRVNR